MKAFKNIIISAVILLLLLMFVVWLEIFFEINAPVLYRIPLTLRDTYYGRRLIYLINSRHPAINSLARERARRISCASNLKQIGLGLWMYANDYNGFFPVESGGAGFEKLRSLDYITDYKMFVCPSSETIPGRDANPLTEGNVSYCYQGGLKMSDGAKSVVCWDKPDNHVSRHLFSMYPDGSKNGYFNVLFADGHIEGYQAESWEALLKKHPVWILKSRPK